MKTCNVCGTTKPLTDYYKNKGMADGLLGCCKACSNRQRLEWGRKNRDYANQCAREWRTNNPDLARARDFRQRCRKHGTSPEAAKERYESQGFVCGCCRDEFPLERLVIDHDHACCPGKYSCGSCIRGLICHLCNVALGGVKDEVARAKAVGDYLLRNMGLTV